MVATGYEEEKVKENRFKILSSYELKGDQPTAVKELAESFNSDSQYRVLLGITGSGKTFTIANVIEKIQKPTLIIAHNKTLAAQLFEEMKALFPQNAVEYFVSYYDYYQPEAYVPTTDTYIEKDASINEKIDMLRHSATRSLLTRRDVIIVATVSCIYGIGSAEDYREMLLNIENGELIGRDSLMRKLVDMQYMRNDTDFHRGTFRVRGDTVEIFPIFENEKALRIEFWGDTVERISEIDYMRGSVLERVDSVILFPGSHYVAPKQKLASAIEKIRNELLERLSELEKNNRLLERQRLGERTLYDLEMLEQTGHCQGIENYSRHLCGRGAGEAPDTLIDYFPKDFVAFVDESHQTIPQLGAMYKGDRSRKETLIDYGFRLPSALDNRPLKLDEFESRAKRICCVSATPGDYEMKKASGRLIMQIIRPTGLMDPEVTVRDARDQVDDLLHEIRDRVSKNERVLITTLTKRMAEDLTEYYEELGVKVRYLHSDIETLDRVEILRGLRRGDFDVLIGINLLREGLDLPEVSLVAIMDADKEGFLRSTRSLIQTMGRASRNSNGKVIMYAENMTAAMKEAIEITSDRRARQSEYNERHKITPTTVRRGLGELGPGSPFNDYVSVGGSAEAAEEKDEALIDYLREEMLMSAEALEFEKAAMIRDRLKGLLGGAGLNGKIDGKRKKKRGRR